MNGITCQSLNNCPHNTYRDHEILSCEQCSEGCLGCYGPTTSECLRCDYQKGYVDLGTGNCQLLVCAEGTYLTIDEELEIGFCTPCTISCKTCNELHFCLECNPGFTSKEIDNKAVCEGCPKGYFFDRSKCRGKIKMTE